MKDFFSSAAAVVALAALSGCGGTGNAAMPPTSAASPALSVHPNLVYRFYFVNHTSESFDVTRSHIQCMSVPPPENFRLEAGGEKHYSIDTTCLIDPSTFKLAFVSSYAQIGAFYRKDTFKPWTVQVSDSSTLKLDFEKKDSDYWTTLHF
jgi:predicted small lipoprotein YifL